MTTKEYLMQIEKWDKIINNRLNDISELRDKADGVSSVPYDKDRVVTSGTKSKIEDIVTKIIDLERQVNIYIDMRQKIISQLEELNYDEYNVLYMRYVNCLAFPVICHRLNREDAWSESRMFKAHKCGLMDFESKFGKQYL